MRPMQGAIVGDPSRRWKCWLVSHKYLRIRYPESPDGHFLRCARCGKEREERGGAGYSGGMNLGS